MSKKWGGTVALGALLALGAACGGSEQARRQEQPHQRIEIPQAEDPEGSQFEGILGQLDPNEARAALERRMDSFMRCYADRLSSVEYLGGSVELTLRIGTDGAVRWAYVSRSDMGDLDTERCLLSVAQRTAFPRPHGGEAEFRYPLEFEPGDGVRPPVAWREDRVVATVDSRRRDLSGCSLRGALSVTAYVEPGGRVAAVGAAAQSRETAEAASCVAQAVAGWTFPDPGSYAAKVTFQVN